jgi:hypothetical protein
MQELKKIGLEIIIFISGMAGAFVSLRKEENLSVGKVLFHLTSGGLTANYLTPLIASVININSSAYLFCGFVIGYMGYKGAEMAVTFLKGKFKR